MLYVFWATLSALMFGFGGVLPEWLVTLAAGSGEGSH